MPQDRPSKRRAPAPSRKRVTQVRVSTTPEVAGHTLVTHHGFVAAQSIRRFSSWADDGLEQILDDARTEALERLRRKAMDLGGNAVVGTRIDIEGEAGNFLIVHAAGTAVSIAVRARAD